MSSTYDSDDKARNPYASANQWRHQESSSYARHAGRSLNVGPQGSVAASSTGDLADFLNKSRIETPGSEPAPGSSSRPITLAAPEPLETQESSRKDTHKDSHKDAHEGAHAETSRSDGKHVVCGPLLNYRRMEGDRWHGSVLVVVSGGGKVQPFRPTLALRSSREEVQDQDKLTGEGEGEGEGKNITTAAAASVLNDDPIVASASVSAPVSTSPSASASVSAPSGENDSQRIDQRIDGICLYSDPRYTFWAFDLSVPMATTQTRWEYELPDLRFSSDNKPRISRFYVPAVTESMRIMFHSCNGFSVGTDEEAWSGPALWNDVLRRHEETPFHVMIGGGDQIYNDGIRVNGPLRNWTDISSPRKRQQYSFTESLRQKCDDYYVKNYIRWYSTAAFAVANGQIPQLNIWDDHDIIDGFGSYVDQFMRCPVFRGIGDTAHKYYMLFQHHLPPPAPTATTDTPRMGTDKGPRDPSQSVDTYVAEPRSDSGYIVGVKPGRTRHQINYPETYNLVFERLRSELSAAANSGSPINHLILLLGIPIAYPRLTWLENVLRSPVIGPIKFLNRRFGVGGGFFNHFDGSVDLLDDLDDHYTARIHKRERRYLMEKLQEIAGEFSVRMTILGGDVHLAALGRFYSSLKLRIPTENDHRFMINVVSSAITNKPPPQAIANLLARRNKIHHLDVHTDETMLYLFNRDPGNSSKTANHNHATMPSRNYAILTENSPSARAPVANGNANGAHGSADSKPQFPGKNGHTALHAGEVGCGTDHKASKPETHGRGNDGGLDVCIQVEIDQHDHEGRTEGYGLSVPLLRAKKELVAAQIPTEASPVAAEAR